eukprot:2302470-Prymnesium_polylepis.2
MSPGRPRVGDVVCDVVSVVSVLGGCLCASTRLKKCSATSGDLLESSSREKRKLCKHSPLQKAAPDTACVPASELVGVTIQPAFAVCHD